MASWQDDPIVADVAGSGAPQPRWMSDPVAEPAAEERGFLVPLVKPAGAKEFELGVPGIIKAPFDAARRLMSEEGQYRAGSSERDQGVKDSFDAAGGAMTGALAAVRPAGAIGTASRMQSRPAHAPLDLVEGAPAAAASAALPKADDAAVQLIADQMQRAGLTVDDLQQRLAANERARTFHSSGRAPDAMALADADESLARLVGSAVRQQPEAANVAREFIYARQSGATPAGTTTQEMAERGLPTRDRLARPVTAEKAKADLGTDFGAGSGNLVPMGQHERIRDALRRSLVIFDDKHHGHASNAYRTEQGMQKALKAKADELYPAAWKSAEEFDLAPAFAGLEARKNQINDPGVHSLITRVQRLFTSAQGNGGPLGSATELKQFDLAKQRLDGLIDRYKGNDTFLYRTLSAFKSELLDAVHGGDRINPTRNRAYGEARNHYATQKEAQEAIDLGRSAWRESADVGVDTFRGLETKAQKDLFRLGMLEGYDRAGARMRTGADRTQLFDNPRMQELLSEVIPRTQTTTRRVKKGAEFGDRPERFGSFVADEGRMIRTRDVVSGNSKTAERMADDAAFDTLHTFIEIFKNPSVVQIGKRGLEYALNKTFGMRADTATQLAEQLLTADPARRAAVINAIQRRMGPTRFARFAEIMEEYQRMAIAPAQRSATGATATGVGGLQQE